MSKLTVLAKFVAKEERLEEARTFLMSVLAPTRAEKGCINYDLHQDNKEPTHFFLYENWESKADLDAHLASPHLKAYFEIEDQLFAKPANITLASQIGES